MNMADDPNATPANPAALNPDLAGYPSVEALVAGYRASSQEAKKWMEEAQRKDREFQTAANPRPEIPQRSTDPFARLADYGVPPDDLRQGIREEIQAAFAPLARGFEARNQILTQHSDYGKFEADVAQFIAQDANLSQVYNRMFQAE